VSVFVFLPVVRFFSLSLITSLVRYLLLLVFREVCAFVMYLFLCYDVLALVHFVLSFMFVYFFMCISLHCLIACWLACLLVVRFLLSLLRSFFRDLVRGVCLLFFIYVCPSLFHYHSVRSACLFSHLLPSARSFVFVSFVDVSIFLSLSLSLSFSLSPVR